MAVEDLIGNPVNLANDLQTQLAQRGRRELLPQLITETSGRVTYYP